MFYFKGCVRCNGDLHEAGDQYGSYVACLQCGHHLTEAEEFDLKLFGPETWLEAASSGWEEKVAA